MTITPEMTRAVQILRTGGLVAMPTETVYGLAADARNEKAVQRIFAAKERPANHPLIVHIADIDQLTDWAREVPPEAYILAQAFWPGPLTLILKKQPHVSALVTAGQDTVGVRIPRHPVALALLKAFGGGVAAPSANRFTHISPTTAAAVREELGDKVDLVLEGGECEVGLESTIINLSGYQPVILRPGMIGAADLTRVLAREVSVSRMDTPVSMAPGAHHVHYAPQTSTKLVTTAFLHRLPASIKPETGRIAVMTYSGAIHPDQNIHLVTMPNNASAYAHELYQTLRALDQQEFQCIYIECVPDEPAWDAIRDRITKASARGEYNE